MFCTACGARLVDGALFCTVCGARVHAGALAPEPLVAAAYARRVIAWMIDATIVLVLPVAALAVVIVQSQPPGQDTSEPGQTGVGFLLPLAAPLYSALLHRYWHGQTIGKRLLRIRVVTQTGRGISLGASLGRSYLRMVLFIMFWIPWVVDSLWPLSNAQRQSLHDLAAGTVVIPA